jgi:hypothetical protein
MATRMNLKKQLRKLLIETAKLPNQEEIDRVLDKISVSGMESLTPEEKAVLDNPEAEPEKEPYVDPYEEDELDLDDMDSFVNDLSLMKRLERRWSRESLSDEPNDYQVKTGSGKIINFTLIQFFDKRHNNVFNYHTNTNSIQIDNREYETLMKGVDSSDAESIIKSFLSKTWGIYNIEQVMFERLNDY